MPDRLVLPPALKHGDTLAVVTPSWSGPAELPAAYQRGLAELRRAGFRVRPMPHAEGRLNDWVAATAEHRADDINTAFVADDVAGIICTIGGEHSAQLLPHIDLDLVVANPKVFCGYSDVTVLLHALHARTGLVGCYGPALIPQWGAVGGMHAYSAAHFATVTSHARPAGQLPTVDYEVQDGDFERAERTGRPLRRTPAAPRQCLRGGRASGPLLPGCLPSVRRLLGTPWQPDHAGRALLLETPEPPYELEHADADLTHLGLAGCLDDLAALVLCRPYGWSNERTDRFHQLVLRHVDQAKGGTYPVLARVEGGHTDPLPTFGVGVQVTVDADRAELSIDGAAVR